MRPSSAVLRTCVVFLIVFASASLANAQEPPYFVTYSHYLEEPHNLEVAVATTTGLPKSDNRAYTAPWLELEYGLTGWWTSELYLEGVTTSHDGSAFTGWRWENRFRPLKQEHVVNPVLYVEFESITEASRIQKEIVGSGSLAFEPIADLQQDHARELEAKLILSSALHGWNVSENITVEKNVSADEGFEFGYSVGISRSLANLASGRSCRVCRENFVAGIEAYGGLGTTDSSGLADTRHYLAPVIGWNVSDRGMIKFSTAFGLTDASDRYLIRVGYAYEFTIGGR